MSVLHTLPFSVMGCKNLLLHVVAALRQYVIVLSVVLRIWTVYDTHGKLATVKASCNNYPVYIMKINLIQMYSVEMLKAAVNGVVLHYFVLYKCSFMRVGDCRSPLCCESLSVEGLSTEYCSIWKLLTHILYKSIQYWLISNICSQSYKMEPVKIRFKWNILQ